MWYERQIWKWALWEHVLAAEDFVEIAMPKDAEVLCVQMQGEVPCVWARVDPTAPAEIRKFRVAGTGHTIDIDGRYIGTFQLAGGALVFHAFDLKEGVE